MGFIDSKTGEPIEVISITKNSFTIKKLWSGKLQSMSIEMFNRFYTEDMSDEVSDLL